MRWKRTEGQHQERTRRGSKKREQEEGARAEEGLEGRLRP